MVRGSAGIIFVSHVVTVARQSYLDIPARASRATFAHFFWPNLIWVCLTGYVLGFKVIGDVRPACQFPLVKSKCFLDSGVRRCCKVGHSCMRRAMDCSSVPHKMPWRSVARAIRTVARLGGPGCEFFDISQLRLGIESTFQFKSWTRRLRGVAGELVLPCPASI